MGLGRGMVAGHGRFVNSPVRSFQVQYLLCDLIADRLLPLARRVEQGDWEGGKLFLGVPGVESIVDRVLGTQVECTHRREQDAQTQAQGGVLCPLLRDTDVEGLIDRGGGVDQGPVQAGTEDLAEDDFGAQEELGTSCLGQPWPIG